MDRELRAEGMDCVSALDVCPELLVRPGQLTRRKPTAADVESFQMELEKELAKFGY